MKKQLLNVDRLLVKNNIKQEKKKRLKSLKETMKKFTCSKKNAASITATPRRVVLGSSELDAIRGLTSKDGHDLFRLTA